MQYPIIDCHIHYTYPAFMEGLMQIIDEHQFSRINIVCTPHAAQLSLVPAALHLKAHAPRRVYVFGGLDISIFFTSPDKVGKLFAEYSGTLMALGCDGIKMIEGKPDIRKMLPIPNFDSSVYEPYWAYLEDKGIPLLWHVNDPEEFWDAQKIPAWARQQGWFYGDGTFVNNEDQYSQVINVLDRHPMLKIIFAHFFFLSAQLPRLAEYLERFPNICIDLTPGVEMYDNFTANYSATREFFIKYQDRILFGTDIGAKALLATPEMGIEPGESRVRAYLVRSFLEKDGEFRLPERDAFLFGEPRSFKGISLPQDALVKIYFKNFERLAGIQPKPLNPRAIATECERLVDVIGFLGAAQTGQPGDPTTAQMVKTFFEQV